MSTRSALLGCCAAVALALPAHAQTVVAEPVVTTTEVVVTEPASPPAPGTATTTETTTVDTAAGSVTTPTETTTVEPAPNAGAFDALSPGGQKIARSLYDAQRLPVTTTAGGAAVAPAGWSLDDIAAARQGTGWGNVFKQMQAEGVVQAKNLGQVVSGKAVTAQPDAVIITTGDTATATTYRHTRQTPVVVSYGNGGTTVVTKGGGHGHGRTAIVTADGGALTGGAAAKPVKAHTQAASSHTASVAATTSAAVTAHGNSGAAKANGGGKGHSN